MFCRQTWQKNCASTIFLSSDVAKIFLFSLWNLRFLKKVHYFSDKTFFKPTKKPEKWKKHSVLIFVLATTFVKICPCLIWQFPKLPRYKKGNLGNISQPRPTASASKNFSSVPFFYLGNLGKSQIRRGQILPQTWREQISKQNTVCLFVCNWGHLTEWRPAPNVEALPIPEELVSYIGM